jgi:hypothetical protein
MPELSLSSAPAWMCDRSTGYLLPSHYSDFATYAATLVKYYNTHAGFVDADGISHVHGNYTPITYWGIFDQPNEVGLSPSQYTALYGNVAAAMQAAQSEIPIKFVGLQIGGSLSTQPFDYIDAFTQNVGGQVDVLAAHFYSGCNYELPDSSIMQMMTSSLAPLVTHILESASASPNAAIAQAPIWIIDENVIAEPGNSSSSSCQVASNLAADRESGPFAVAWRSYMYSQLASAGVGGIYNSVFAGDQGAGELDRSTGSYHLLYWADYYLQYYFCGLGGSGECDQHTDLQTTSSEGDDRTVEIFATGQDDNSLTIMIVNHAVAAPSDFGGAGAPRTVVLDVSALGSFAHGTEVDINQSTDPAVGPVPQEVGGASQIAVQLPGYGTSFVLLTRSSPSANAIRLRRPVRVLPPPKGWTR